MHLSPDVRFNAILQPNIKEFLDVYEDFAPHTREEDIERVDEQTKLIKEVCEKQRVIPFFGIRFDYHGRENSFATTELDYGGPNLGTRMNNEPYRSSNNPMNFTGNKKFYFISFLEVQGENNQEEVRRAIELFISEGYILTSLFVELEPWEHESGYYTRSGDKGSFHARNGKIQVYGDTNFIPNLPEEITQGLKSLEERLD